MIFSIFVSTIIETGSSPVSILYHNNTAAAPGKLIAFPFNLIMGSFFLNLL